MTVQSKKPLPGTSWLPTEGTVLSPDYRHAYAHTRRWDLTQPVLSWVLLHPLPNTTVLDRCQRVAQESGFGGIDVRYLFTRITSNQEDLVNERVVNAPHAAAYLTGLAPTSVRHDAPVMAGWKLRGGTSELREAVAERVRQFARTGVHVHTPDPAGRAVLSPTKFPRNLLVDGYQELAYTATQSVTIEQTPPRILMTGSRSWTDGRTMRSALSWASSLFGAHPLATLVEGECPLGGADRMAADAWRDFSLPVDPFPADVDPSSGRVLGPQRNARMVSSGAHLCVAFRNDGSRGGTRDCVERAAGAGIPIVQVKEWTQRG